MEHERGSAMEHEKESDSASSSGKLYPLSGFSSDGGMESESDCGSADESDSSSGCALGCLSGYLPG